ncbi:MAG TPA: hypothetical protein VFW52_02660 [Candidatus Saccharimonadales bacterium]|nr:hypothetical protein [Candidatus Saccharimonadales bacterium]
MPERGFGKERGEFIYLRPVPSVQPASQELPLRDKEFEYPAGTQLFTDAQMNQITIVAHSFGMSESQLITEAIAHSGDKDAFAAITLYVNYLITDL